MGTSLKKLISESKEYYYVKPLLTKTEYQFYVVLCEVLQAYKEIILLTKIRIADILEPSVRPSEDYKVYKSLYGRIVNRHFDFVLCNRRTMKILCIMELNDHSQNRIKGSKRDEFIHKACEVAGLEIFMFEVSNRYSIKSLKVILDTISG